MLSDKQKSFFGEVIYEIYPRSFLDSDGDGIGDINGIIDHLDYLNTLGVTAIWLGPCYKSPNVDNGYDVSDYYDIMDEFGTMEDMKKLISELHARKMKLIMDLVPNHTSSEHEWFKRSRESRDNPYSDFYYWFDKPLNDWGSGFGGSAWEFDEKRGQYYLHSYSKQQPDLNWENPKVVKAMQDVVDFWVDMGVDGFRIDVIDQISKDFAGGRNCFGPTLHQHIRELFGCEKTRHLFTVGECWCNDIEEISRHCSSERNELTTLFQFEHLECGRSDKYTPTRPSLKELRDVLIKWQMLYQEQELLQVLFTDNHDNPYLLSRVGDDRKLRYEAATCIATMVYGMKGVPLIYQGQEAGLTSSQHKTIDEFNDVETINMYNEFRKTMSEEEAMQKINFGSRDNARRPIPWRDCKGYGFTYGTPWIPFHSRSDRLNFADDLKWDKSVIRFYQRLMYLRKQSDVMKYGNTEVLSKEEDNFLIYRRVYGGRHITVICNFESESEITSEEGEILMTNRGRTTASGTYLPYEAAIINEPYESYVSDMDDEWRF